MEPIPPAVSTITTPPAATAVDPLDELFASSQQQPQQQVPAWPMAAAAAAPMQVHPATTTSSNPAAAGFTGAAPMPGMPGAGSVGSPSLADGFMQRQAPPTAPAPAPPAVAVAQAGAGGFEDTAFAPDDGWRVLGDVRQWHAALLVKDKVRMHIPPECDAALVTLVLCVS
jgi:hypothetical protein